MTITTITTIPITAVKDPVVIETKTEILVEEEIMVIVIEIETITVTGEITVTTKIQR